MIDNTPIDNANVAEKYAIDLLADRAEQKQKDRLLNLENKVNELEKAREVKDSLNSVAVDSILSILRETRLEAELLNSIFSDAIDKISREKQFLEDSLIQYQLEYIDSLNKTKEAYIDSFQNKMFSNK